MMCRRGLTWFFAAMLALSLTACSDDDDNDNNGQPTMDAGDVTDVADAEDDVSDAQDDVSDAADAEDDATDVTDATDTQDTADAPDDGAPDPDAATQIADVLDGNTGTISGAAVTYVRMSFGSDDPGFFVQATQDGPAIFVAIDPTDPDGSEVDLEQGDIITFDATATETANGITYVTEIANLVEEASNYDVTPLTQNVTDNADWVTNLDNYTSELLLADVEITGEFDFAGSGFLAAQVDTSAITENENLVLRIPELIQDQLGLHNGCSLTVGPTPLWRFNETAQLSVWNLADVSNVTCEATELQEAVALSDTEVELTFDRNIDPASIATDASTQFTITPSLDVTGATVDGNTVTLTTAQQDGGTEYSVEVADTVEDIFGAGIDAANNTAVFFGFVPPAAAVISEVNANIDGGCDMVELRITQDGSLDGFQLWERTSAAASFSAGFTVEAGDIVVVHFDHNDTNCNPGGAVSENASITGQPESTYASNYDTAWDWWTQDTGITATDNVLTLYDSAGNIVDAVFLADDATCGGRDTLAAGGTEDQAAVVAAAGEWALPDGTQPADWIGTNFCSNAVLGLGSTGADASGTSIQRTDDTDDDNVTDWTESPATSTWGEVN